jgi:hypothetical protein
VRVRPLRSVWINGRVVRIYAVRSSHRGHRSVNRLIREATVIHDGRYGRSHMSITNLATWRMYLRRPLQLVNSSIRRWSLLYSFCITLHVPFFFGTLPDTMNVPFGPDY